jgi:hypothetical protein
VLGTLTEKYFQDSFQNGWDWERVSTCGTKLLRGCLQPISLILSSVIFIALV